jgi:hypothetical protein
MADLYPSEKPDDIVSEAELIAIIGVDDDEDQSITGDVVSVCDGEWRREPDGRWRIWLDPKRMD